MAQCAPPLPCVYPDANEHGKYDLIVLDPPWENASAHRAQAYLTLPHRRLLKLPLPKLLSPNSLVALWVTTRPKLRRVVDSELLPAWGLRLLRVWLWLKVNTDGSPVCPLVCCCCCCRCYCCCCCFCCCCRCCSTCGAVDQSMLFEMICLRVSTSMSHSPPCPEPSAQKAV